MKSRSNFSFHKIKNQIDFRQEIQRYVLLLLIPLFFCIALYISVQKITFTQLKSNAEHTVNQFYLQMSAMMHETDLIDRALCTDFVTLNNEENNSLLINYDNPSSICKQISIRMEGSDYINHIYFISEKTQRIYSDDGYYSYSSLKSILWNLGIDYDSFFDISEQKWNMIADNHLAGPYCITPFRDSDNNITGYLLIALNLDVFIHDVFDLNTDFACLYNEETFITSKSISSDYAIADLASEKTVSKMLGQPVKCFYINIDDLTYMIAMKKSDYFYPFTTIGICFLLYAVAIFISGYLYLYKVSKERYREISDLIHALPQENTSFSYKDLVPAVQTALLESRYKNQAQQQIMNEHIFHDILYTHCNSTVLKKYLKQIGIQSENSTYYIVVFHIKFFNNIALVSSDTEDTQHLVWTIFQTAVNQFTDPSIQTFSCTDPDHFNTIFCSPSNKLLDLHVMAACESIIKFLNDEYGIFLHAAISSATTESQQIITVFGQAKNLEKFSIAIDNNSRIISEDLLHKNSGLLLKGDFFRQEHMLINTLLIGKYDAVPSMVDSILQEHVAPLTSDYSLADNRLKAISSILTEALFNLQSTSMNLNFYAEDLRQADSISTLTSKTTDIFTQLANASLQLTPSHKEVDRACEYISKHLKDPNLNVTMICDAVGIIVQRLTPMFQEQLNMGIAEYANYRRIEEAKKLLIITKLTVNQIAEEVGYSTTDTFTRNFRKLENLTPTEYRKIIT